MARQKLIENTDKKKIEKKSDISDIEEIKNEIEADSTLDESVVAQKIEATEKLSTSEITDIQKGINKEILKQKKEDAKKKKQNPSYLFLTFFIKRLKEDKLYLFSFLVTIAFFSIFSVKKLQETEGYYDRKKGTNTEEKITTPTSNDNQPKEPVKETPITDELDITDYIGIYSREVTLSSPLVMSATCNITDYKIVYQIKKDKSIAKYFINDCLGTIKMWDDTLKYVSSSGARYISANSINFLFSTTNMKEVDGETYKIDEEMTQLRENKKDKTVTPIFYENNIILMSKSELVLLKGANITYQLSKEYKLQDVVEEIVYKSNENDNQFNFIVYDEADSKKCYTEEESKSSKFVDADNYKIYSIQYDNNIGNFTPAEEKISRKKSDGCELFQSDLESLKK